MNKSAILAHVILESTNTKLLVWIDNYYAILGAKIKFLGYETAWIIIDIVERCPRKLVLEPVPEIQSEIK